MKTRLFLFAFGIVLLMQSCEETPEIIPDVLPPITHEGANTFGAYIKGNIFVPLDNTFKGILSGNVPHLRTQMTRYASTRQDVVDISVIFRNRNRIRDERFLITLIEDSLVAGATYTLPTARDFWDSRYAGVIYTLKVDHNQFVDFRSDSTLPFTVHIHHIVRDQDSTNLNAIKELSATFSGLLIDSQHRTIEVKDGRFDLQSDLWITD